MLKQVGTAVREQLPRAPTSSCSSRSTRTGSAAHTASSGTGTEPSMAGDTLGDLASPPAATPTTCSTRSSAGSERRGIELYDARRTKPCWRCRRVPRHRRHAHRVRQEPDRGRRPLRPPWPIGAAATTPRPSRPWCRRSSSTCRPRSGPTTSACSPATPRSTPMPRSSAAPRRSSPTWRCARAGGADVGQVVMDEFHYFADPDRGWAWQVPLLELPDAQLHLDVRHARRRDAVHRDAPRAHRPARRRGPLGAPAPSPSCTSSG